MGYNECFPSRRLQELQYLFFARGLILTLKKLVIGMKICFFTIKGLLAQRLEQRTHNPLVVGSNPTGPTSFQKLA